MNDDWMTRLQETADRFREAAETPHDPKPETVKRPYSTPSGASARSMKAKNAYQRIQAKKGNR